MINSKNPLAPHRPLLMNVLLAFSLLMALILTSPQPTAAILNPVQPATPPGLFVLRVYTTTPAQTAQLAASGLDVLEARGPDYLLVIGDMTVEQRLIAQGFRVQRQRALSPISKRTAQGPSTYFAGYRTVAEHEAHMAALAAARPDLAAVVDYGDSWLKVNGSPSGHDLVAICITRRRPNTNDCALNPETDKPRFLLMAAIHARELTTSELAWRWMDELVNGYNVDPEITALLDYSEMWVIPVVNPDGRAKVEEGGDAPIMQRKNMNGSPGSCGLTAFSQGGVDLNRNASVGWGGIGSSTSLCDQTYRGAQPSSEPEQYFLEALFRQLFRDQRPDDPAVPPVIPAPITTTGGMLSLHSFGNFVLFPWGYTTNPAPNAEALRNWAFRLSYYNGYNTGTPPQILYTADGITDDWTYGTLGIASATFEVGPASGECGDVGSPTGLAFSPPYSCQDSKFWPENKDAFLAAAKLARQPYALSLGPVVLSATVGVDGVLSATVADDALGVLGPNRPATQVITQVEAYLDVPPWMGGAPTALAAQDGAYDTARELASASINVSVLCGRHILFVRGQDAAGNWGPARAVWVQGTASECRTYYLPIVGR